MPAAESAAWRALRSHWRAQKNVSLRRLFAEDARRFQNFSVEAEGFLLDFSKTALASDSLRLLFRLASAARLAAHRRAMFAGGTVNKSEKRAALHTALRAEESAEFFCGGENIMPAVAAERRKMLAFAEKCRSEKKHSDVLHIGIGGSDLGPKTAAAALQPLREGDSPRIRFISNMDGAHLAKALQNANPRNALIIVSSKTFTTAETMANARDAMRWMQNAVGKKRAREQCIAITAAPSRAREFGAGAVFRSWEWVGGRYCLWGAAGLPVALAIGKHKFNEMLAGARAMDMHFLSAPVRKNLPAMLALIGVWHRNVCGYPTRAVIPYEERLRLLPQYLQQLDMESNGKNARQDGAAARIATAPVVWGAAGTDAQHAFFQMLHQGSDIVPCEFIVAARDGGGDDIASLAPGRRRLVVANCLAQSSALMLGKAGGDGCRRFPGNRPSVTLMTDEFNPRAFGALLALYEHRAFCEGTLWGVNPFDQWGVELGKTTASEIADALCGDVSADGDSSTRGLAGYYRLRRK